MRFRYFFILILSLIIPLQAAAGVLLNAPCPDAADMSAMNDEKMSHMMADMPCCPDKAETEKPDCKTMDDCHMCKVPGQLVVYRTVALATTLVAAEHLLPLDHAFAIFNPASIWRPPSFT